MSRGEKKLSSEPNDETRYSSHPNETNAPVGCCFIVHVNLSAFGQYLCCVLLFVSTNPST